MWFYCITSLAAPVSTSITRDEARLSAHLASLRVELASLRCDCTDWFAAGAWQQWMDICVAHERQRILRHAQTWPTEWLPTCQVTLNRPAFVSGRISPFDYFEMEYPCANESRLPRGVLGDGPKWVCGPTLHPPPCRVLSLGSDFDDAFERALHQAAGCTSLIVDPSLPMGSLRGLSSADAAERVRAFEARLQGYGASLNTSVGVGRPGARMKTGHEKQTAKEGSSSRARPLGTKTKQPHAIAMSPAREAMGPPLVPIRVLLADRYGDAWPLHLSILKVDIESSEYDVLPSLWQLCAVGALSLDQLNLEVHLADEHSLKEMHALFAGARQCSLMLHHKEVNTLGKFPCAEFSWVSTRHAERVLRAMGASLPLTPPPSAALNLHARDIDWGRVKDLERAPRATVVAPGHAGTVGNSTTGVATMPR